MYSEIAFKASESFIMTFVTSFCFFIFPAPIIGLSSSFFFALVFDSFFLGGFALPLAFLVDGALELESLSELESSESLIFFLAGFFFSVVHLGSCFAVFLIDFPTGAGESDEESELELAFLFLPPGLLDSEESLELI